jgi:prepilin peptidase CpaA
VPFERLTMTALCESLLLWVALIAVVVAAAIDVKLRLIPNVVVLVMAGAGVGLRVLTDGWASWESLVLAIGTFLPLGLLAGRDMVGGGDAKMIAAVTLLVEPSLVPQEFLAIALAGGFLGIVYLARQHRALCLGAANSGPGAGTVVVLAAPNAVPDSTPMSLPYGVAIAAGAAFVLFRGVPECWFGTSC